VCCKPMCGRFTQAYTWSEVHALLDVIGPARNLRPRYNIAPTESIEVVRQGDGGRELLPMRWGLVPRWWKKPLDELPSTFNARAESIDPLFRLPLKYRRCIVPASGFYEWAGKAGAKTPHYFSSASGEPIALAGVWDVWLDPESGETIPSAAIIVGAANEWMARFHNRAPIMIERKDFDAWLSGVDPAALLRVAREDSLQEWIVSSRVNRSSVGDDDPTLINREEMLCGGSGVSTN
jgi:putative SOS response-associated peptidase YedK